ncbi:hypothetical protein KIPB_008330, partial [Kipferlia bialata]
VSPVSYCTECREMLCRDCSVGPKHSGHTVALLADLSRRAPAEIVSSIPLIEQAVSRLAGLKGVLTRVISANNSNKDTLERQIDAHYDRIVEEANQHRRHAHLELANAAAGGSAPVTAILSRIGVLQSTSSLLRDEIKTARGEGGSAQIDLLFRLRDLRSSLSELTLVSEVYTAAPAREGGVVVTAANFQPGCIVERNPSVWRYGDVDGGEGGRGALLALQGASSASVRWASEPRNSSIGTFSLHTESGESSLVYSADQTPIDLASPRVSKTATLSAPSTSLSLGEGKMLQRLREAQGQLRVLTTSLEKGSAATPHSSTVTIQSLRLGKEVVCDFVH